MKLLNIGCGTTAHKDWVNLDFFPRLPYVAQVDIRKGIPYPDNHFDVVYHSHLLEHISRAEGILFLEECFRVLKKDGIIRVVVPDLEGIARVYLDKLEALKSGSADNDCDYEWILLEMYDQTTRSFGGGEMLGFMLNPKLKNKNFILSRTGFEAESIFSGLDSETGYSNKAKILQRLIKLINVNLVKTLAYILLGKKGKESVTEGFFRNSGEIHKTMYDCYSLKKSLKQVGFRNLEACSASESKIGEFGKYELDCVDNRVRKPDSIFIEGIK